MSIVVTSPNGDNGIQDWRVCTETTITWTSGGTSNYFRVYYSLNNGNSWITLNSNYYSPGFNNTYNWVMPNTPIATALVRVEDRFNAAQVDESDNPFTIAPAITLLAPNGGEVLDIGQPVTISWLNEGATNTVASPTMTTIYALTVTDSFGCTAAADVTITLDNGLCDIEGCVDNTAYNFNPNATIDNGFCLYTSGGNGSCPTDIDGDGIVSTSDLLLILGSFGSTCQ